MHQPARASEVALLVGDVDPLAIARIVETGASLDEIDEALRAADDDTGPPRDVSSSRVAEVRAILDELAAAELADEEAVS